MLNSFFFIEMTPNSYPVLIYSSFTIHINFFFIIFTNSLMSNKHIWVKSSLTELALLQSTTHTIIITYILWRLLFAYIYSSSSLHCLSKCLRLCTPFRRFFTRSSRWFFGSYLINRLLLLLLLLWFLIDRRFLTYFLVFF